MVRCSMESLPSIQIVPLGKTIRINNVASGRSLTTYATRLSAEVKTTGGHGGRIASQHRGDQNLRDASSLNHPQAKPRSILKFRSYRVDLFSLVERLIRYWGLPELSSRIGDGLPPGYRPLPSSQYPKFRWVSLQYDQPAPCEPSERRGFRRSAAHSGELPNT